MFTSTLIRLFVLVFVIGCTAREQVNISAARTMDYRKAPSGELLNLVKYSGCTIDGLIGTNNTGIEYKPPSRPATRLALFNEYAGLIGRSHCIYLNRAVETWNGPPDFDAIADNLHELHDKTHRPFVIGEFVAEHLPLSIPYTDGVTPFQFSDMCAATPAATDTSCRPSFGKSEYRRYFQYIVQRSIDAGIQVFLLGGEGLTEPTPRVERSLLVPLIEELKQYALEHGTHVLFV